MARMSLSISEAKERVDELVGVLQVRKKVIIIISIVTLLICLLILRETSILNFTLVLMRL